MCGKETAGLGGAEATLYEGAAWVLVPLARTAPDALTLAKDLALSVGAQPLVLGVERHDRLVAAISHVPYALAVALTLATAEVGEGDDMVWKLAASGFRDTSRLAASDVTMMLDILLTNRAEVAAGLRRVSAHWESLADVVAAGDEAGLRAMLSAAREARSALFAPPLAGGGD